MKTTALRISFVVLLLTLYSSASVRAQDRVNILEAGSLTQERIDGEPVQKILHNVHLRMGDFEMYCDSAYRFLERAEVRAYGNIEIITEEERIWADSLAYFTDIDFSQLRGRVIIVSDSTTLYGSKVDYRFSTKVGHFLEGVRLEDPQGVLRANSGFYYREADSAVFRGQVQVADSTQYLEGDSLFTNRSSQFYKLYGQIYAHDEENRSTLAGNYLEADSTGRRLLRGDAWLRRVSVDTVETDSSAALRPDPIPRDSTGAGRPLPPDSLRGAPPDSTRSDSTGNRTGVPPPPLPGDSLTGPSPAVPHTDSLTVQRDTTHIRSREILMRRVPRVNGDTVNTVDARDSVRIWSPRFSSLSDSARYDSGTETFELYEQPRAWYETIQLSGPYIRVELQEGRVNRLVSYPQPFAVQQDTATNRLNQITGDTLQADFAGGTLSRIRTGPGGRLLRFMSNAEGRPDGAVGVSADEIRILFEEGELVEVKNLGSPSGYTLPESEETAGHRLNGFRWEPQLRPQRPRQQMQPRFDPIPTELPFELPPRYVDYINKVGKS